MSSAGNVVSRLWKLNMDQSLQILVQQKKILFTINGQMTRMDQTNPSFVVNENKSFPLPLLTISKVLHLRFSSKFNALKGFSLLNLVGLASERRRWVQAADKLNYLVIVGP